MENFHLGCIYLALDKKSLISFVLLEVVKLTREIHRSSGVRESILKGNEASFLLPQKLREDDGASNQKIESQKTYDGAMQNMDFGTERRQICRWKQMSKFSKMEARELSTKFLLDIV